MNTRAIRIVVLVAAVSAPCLATSLASAQPGRAARQAKNGDPEDAKLKAGIAFLEAHQLDKAQAEFERVYATSKEPRALFWMGRVLQEKGKLAGALRAYKRYLKDADQSTIQARGVEVMGTIQTLSMQVAVVNVNAPEGSTISVDGVDVGKTPLGEPLNVDVGKHTIVATRNGATASATVDVREEERVSIDMRFEEGAKAPVPTAAAAAAAGAGAQLVANPAPAAPAEPPPSSSSGVSGVTVGGLVVAGLLGVGSVYFAIKAAGTASDFDAKKGELGARRSEIDDLQGDTRLQAGLAVGLGLSAIGVATVTLFVLNKPSAERTASSKITVTGRGVVLSGSF